MNFPTLYRRLLEGTKKYNDKPKMFMLNQFNKVKYLEL